MRVYLLWIVDEDDLYPIDSDVVGVYSTREAAERRAAAETPGYLKRFHIQEREVEGE